MSQNQQKKDLELFTKVVLGLKNSNDVNEFLNLFLTESERESVLKRYKILICLLFYNSTQREVSKSLNLSISKVTAGSKALKHTSQNMRKLLRFPQIQKL